MRSRVGHLLLMTTLAAATPASAQSTGSLAVVRGEIVDAGSGDGLVGASVLLRPDTSADPSPERRTLTDSGGRYRFKDVEPGRYVVRIERIGYRSAELRVTVRSPAEARVSVGLDLDPVALEPVAVRGSASAPYGRSLSEAESAVPSVRLRQQRYLATDARAMTHRQLLESVTMGEADLFRALHRLPSVSTRDDWSAELWIRNAAWDQTRVTLDGLPLFSPLHGGGVFGAVNPDAVGTVYLHPGVRPVRLGDGGAGALELETRPASGRELQGFGELSLASARLALDHATEQGGWMIAGRRTYLDWLTRGVEASLDIEDAFMPYHYSDLTARVDHRFTSGATLAASAAWIRDELHGSVPDLVHGSEAVWGNALGRVTLGHGLGRLRARHTLGITSYQASLDTVPPGPATEGFNAARVQPLDHTLDHAVLRGEIGPRGGAGPGASSAAWGAGYEVVHQAVSALGAPPSLFVDFDITALDSLDLDYSLTRVGAWYERRWTQGAVEVAAGLRVDAGLGVEGSGAVRPAPRVQLRWAASEALTLGAGLGRAYQYAQSPVPIGLPLGVSRTPLFPAGALWLLAGDSVPALRSDAATVGGELWLGTRHLASVTAYARAAEGVLISDPRPGLATDRPLYVAADERTWGVEASVRRLKGPLTGSISYALAKATQVLGALRYPGPADRRHTMDMTARLRLTRGLAAGAAFTYATGSPYTRIVSGPVESGGSVTTVVRGEPNARRMPAYASLDLSLEWMKSFPSWEFGMFVQVRNALNRRNTASYSSSSERCGDDAYGVVLRDGVLTCEPSGRPPRLRDEFVAAMPRIPLFGLRLRF